MCLWRQVAESDFSKMLAEGSAAEDQAQSEYEALTEDNKALLFALAGSS